MGTNGSRKLKMTTVSAEKNMKEDTPNAIIIMSMWSRRDFNGKIF